MSVVREARRGKGRACRGACGTVGYRCGAARAVPGIAGRRAPMARFPAVSARRPAPRRAQHEVVCGASGMHGRRSLPLRIQHAMSVIRSRLVRPAARDPAGFEEPSRFTACGSVRLWRVAVMGLLGGLVGLGIGASLYQRGPVDDMTARPPPSRDADDARMRARARARDLRDAGAPASLGPAGDLERPALARSTLPLPLPLLSPLPLPLPLLSPSPTTSSAPARHGACDDAKATAHGLASRACDRDDCPARPLRVDLTDCERSSAHE